MAYKRAVFRSGGMVEAPVEFRLLGTLEVALDDRPVSLGGSRARALLALLLLHRNEVLALDRIVEELWDGNAPKSAEQIVRVYVSNLRKALPPEVLVTRGKGYVLVADPGQVDAERFDALRNEGHRLLAAGDVPDALKTLDEALALWRGPPLQEFAHESFAGSEIARLEELHLLALEDRFDAQLAAGRAPELVADLEQLVAANPLRERLRAQLMLALYRAGRQADALETYQRGRRFLVEELGLEPSEALRRLETQILQRDPDLDTPTVEPEKPTRRPPRSGRLRLGAAGLALVAIGAVAALLVAATNGNSPRQPRASSLRVSLVEESTRKLSAATPAGLDPAKGLNAAAEDLGVRTSVRYAGLPLSGFLREIAAAARTSNLVIVSATPFGAAVAKVTRRFPHTKFLVPGSVFDKTASFAGQRNVTGMKFADYEDGYVGGYLAGLMMHGKQAISAVGGVRTVESVRDLIAGYKAGARRAKPGIRVLVRYTGTFDPRYRGVCAAAAKRQIEKGSAVVFDVAGGCGIGALGAAGAHGVWGLGVDSNLSSVGPQILASVVKRINTGTRLAIGMFATGQLPGGQNLPSLDLSTGSIGLAGINPRVPARVQAEVQKLVATLRARDRARDSR
jgi:DNA-binding SARP family transcriptional activator/basic membrane lipoprotein Med (substrate-binding protein (PBP1-ABC) superfamily)